MDAFSEVLSGVKLKGALFLARSSRLHGHLPRHDRRRWPLRSRPAHPIS